MAHLLILLLFLVQYGRAQQTFFPAAIPVAVRSPYLSSWDFTTNGTTVGHLWQTISAHQPGFSLGNDDNLELPVYVRVDNKTYIIVGDDLPTSANLTDMVITPTQIKLTAEAGPMQFNLTFLNPIEPEDWVKQSIPFSYLSLTAESLDGAAHSVQVYSDVSGEYLSGDRTHDITWSTTKNDKFIYHAARLRNPAVFNEINSQAEWGTLYFAMASGDNITYQAGLNSRPSFPLDGTLNNLTDTNFRPISQFICYAIARDLGTIKATQAPVVWTVGYTTDPAIQYKDLSTDAPRPRSLYYKIQYPDDTLLIPYLLNDFANASSRAQQLDSKILQDAAAVSGALGDLVSLATAQVYGSIQLTVGLDASGNFNKSDVMAFMKNIGGLNTNRVNAVETLYSAFPALMSIDPALGGLLLEPLFRLQASPNYIKQYAAAELGTSYPNVTISNSDHDQGVEQSGNMLIMTYAQARATGDGSLISRYCSLLTTWADYLSNSTLLIHNQRSADGLTNNNQTNLAIKGIIAIKAMSKMSSVVNRTADADKYSNTAASLYSQWKGLALASDQHILAAYGLADSWTLGYNLFADVWLGTSVVESSVHEGQSSFIRNVTMTSTLNNYGLPADSFSADLNIVASSWNLFAAAMTSNQDLRTILISRVHARASSNTSVGVFPVLYDGASGSTYLGAASPAQGAMYAPLALKVPVLPITANPVTTGTSPDSELKSESKSHTSAITGGAIGGVVALLAVGAITLVVRRRRRRPSGSLKSVNEPDSHFPTTVTPFNPTLTGAAGPETGSHADWQQRRAEPVEPGIVPLIYVSTPLDSRGQSPHVAPIPVGLTSKELARLREDNLHSQPTTASPSEPLLTATAVRSAATSSSEARRIQSEVESLRREMQELRAERFEAPPDYSDA